MRFEREGNIAELAVRALASACAADDVIRHGGRMLRCPNCLQDLAAPRARPCRPQSQTATFYWLSTSRTTSVRAESLPFPTATRSYRLSIASPAAAGTWS